MTELRIFTGQVAGVSHAKPDLSQLRNGDKLTLFHEATNEFDPSAVRVSHPVVGKLGYIPKDSNEVIHSAWSNGFNPVATIRRIESGTKFNKIWLNVVISL